MFQEQTVLFAYNNTPGNKRGSQYIFEEILYCVLERQAQSIPNLAIPVNGKHITEAIFSLNDHDIFEINNLTVGGQKLKELFCILPLLHHVEDKQPNTDIYLCIPDQRHEDGTDISIHIIKPDSARTDEPTREGLSVSKVLPKDLLATLNIQVKEDSEPALYGKQGAPKIVQPSKLDLDKVDRYSSAYPDRFVLIFARKSGVLKTQEWNQKIQHKNVYAVSIPDTSVREVTSDDGITTFRFPSDGFNFLLLIPPSIGVPTVHHAFFSRPDFLLTAPPIPSHRLTPG